MPFDLAIYEALIAGKPGSIALKERALWKLTGNDRVRYLNGQTTNDIVTLKTGRTIYAAVTNTKGKMEGDIFISSSQDTLWIDSEIELREKLGLRLAKYIISDDAELEDVTEQFLVTHVFGSESPAAGENMYVFENPRFGIQGYDVWAPLSEAFKTGLDVPTEVTETLRIEHSLPKWGADMSEETLPPEAGLERNGISYNKGCYVGQEVIARIKSIGHVNKHLVCIRFPTNETAAVGSEIKVDGKVIGKITSTIFSPVLKSGLALGYAQRAHAAVGKNLDVNGVNCTIVEPPLNNNL